MILKWDVPHTAKGWIVKERGHNKEPNGSRPIQPSSNSNTTTTTKLLYHRLGRLYFTCV